MYYPILSNTYQSIKSTFLLTLSQRQNFRQVQIESICKRQIIGDPNGKIVLDKIENIVGKEENAAYKHFRLFPQCFQKDFSSRTLKELNNRVIHEVDISLDTLKNDK